jgi:putative methyltransferase (TIGR04325 family)
VSIQSLSDSLRKVLPLGWLDWYRSGRFGAQHELIWEGIYENFRDVPVTGEGYHSETLALETKAYTQSLLAIVQKSGVIPFNVTNEHALLPLVTSITKPDADLITIMDFGGGMGVDYIHLLSGVTNSCRVDYRIVENSIVCFHGRDLFSQNTHLHFHDALPADLDRVDIVYINSALQYVEDYSGLLVRLCAYEPEFILLVKLSAGEMPTYATAQINLTGSRVPYWFLNVQQIIHLLEANGYHLVYKSVLPRKYDQENFPPQYRMGQACNLLFRQDGKRI